MKNIRKGLIFLAMVVAFGIAYWGGCSFEPPSESPDASATPEVAREVESTPTLKAARATRTPAAAKSVKPTRTPTVEAVSHSGLDKIAASDLPQEALDTLEEIEQGPPYPYERDGITFHNYEKRLPIKEDGYYREFTVKTPGLSNRGPKRIILGEQGELYYTADHYETFMEIVK